MTFPSRMLALTAILALAACEGMTRQEQMVVGGLTGAALGGLTAKALENDDDWMIIGALAGAAIALLYAPTSGRKLQRQLKDALDDQVENVQDAVKKFTR